MFQFNIQSPHFLPHVGCDLRLSLNEGECLVLVGDNGIGKSTIARHIFQYGKVPTAYISQDHFSPFYERSLRTFKDLFLSSCQSQISMNDFRSWWNLSGLHDKEDRLLSHLSGGERQILKIILGVVGTQPLILMDEPSQFLDQKKKELLKSILGHLSAQKKTVLVIEHDLTWMPPGTKVIRLGFVESTIKEVDQWIT